MGDKRDDVRTKWKTLMAKCINNCYTSDTNELLGAMILKAGLDSWLRRESVAT